MKKTITPESLIKALNSHKDELTEHLLKTAPTLILEDGYVSGDGTFYTFRCLNCGKTFSTTAKGCFICSECGYAHERGRYSSKKGLSDYRSKKGAIKEDEKIFFFGATVIPEVDTESLDTMTSIKDVIKGFEISYDTIAVFDTITAQKVSFLKSYSSSEEGEWKKTNKSLYRLFNTVWGVNHFILGFDKGTELYKIVNHCDTMIAKKKKETASLKKESADYPLFFTHPTSSDFEEDIIDIGEVFPMSVISVSQSLTSRDETYRLNCNKCGTSTLIEQEFHFGYMSFTCPHCGQTVIRHRNELLHYRKQIEKRFAASIKQLPNNNIAVKVVSFTKDAKDDKVEKSIVFFAEFTPQGKNISAWERMNDKASVEACSYRKKGWIKLNNVFIEPSEALKYSGFDEYLNSSSVQDCLLKAGLPLQNVLYYLSETLKYPVLEKISKLNLAHLYNEKFSTPKNFFYQDPCSINLKAESVEDAFSLSKPLLRYYRDNQYLSMYAMQQFYSFFPDITGDEIKWCQEESITPEYFVSIKETVPSMSIHKMIEYAERVRVGQMFHPQASLSTWRDYLKACCSLDMDMTDNRVLYPRALKTQHDIVVAKQEFVNNESNKEKFIAAVSKYKDLSYHKDEYFIKVPESPQEMFEEGRKLNHCCGSYVDIVAKEDAFVLFLRKKEIPDEPFLSIEVSPELAVRQVRGKNDTHINILPEHKKIDSFLLSWMKMKHLINSIS